jgi:hypothetical protein
MQKRSRHLLRTRIFATMLALGWILGPAAPSIACFLMEGFEAAPVDVAVPDCHRSAEAESAATPGPRTCCADVTTSCCLRALDVDGAVAAIDLLTAPALAILPDYVSLDLAPAHPVSTGPIPIDGSPPQAPLFQVLRL